MTTDDKILFERISHSRDRQAFDTLFKRYYAQLVEYAGKFLGDGCDAENVVQDVMLYIWEKAPGINIFCKVSTYLYNAVKNRCCTVIARNKTKERILDETVRQLLTEKSLTPSDSIAYKEIYVRYRKALLDMPENRRETFILSREYSKTYEEIAEIQKISAKTVEYRISQALKNIREALPEYFTDLFPSRS